MKIYQNLFAYLNGECLSAENTVLHGCDRPILNISKVNNSTLIQHGENVYEIGFPYLKPTDLEQHDDRCKTEIKVETEIAKYSLSITDEVIDKETIEDEAQLKEWLKTPKQKQLDTSISLLLQSFNSLFNNKDLWQTRQGNIAEINLHYLPEYLSRFDFAEASLPLVISLENQYELSRKLRTITPRLRHQLRRKAELMSIGRIQEMDSYCLRDYIRRPGHSPEEKAGAKQQLMGVKREQNYNTVENKFLIYFAGRLLHLECFRYEHNNYNSAHQDLVRKLRQTIDIFNQSPAIKNISVRHFRLNKPNYVLLQNPIYNSFYRAYQDYIYRRSQKERLWSYRTNLLGDTIYLCLTAAFLRFRGINLKPLSNLATKISPDYGNYLPKDNKVSIPVFLQDFVYEFKLDKSWDLTKGDYCLTIEVHDLKSSALTTKITSFPIWIFWYKPSETIINSAEYYLNNNSHDYSQGILFYLQTSPDITKTFIEEERKLEAELNTNKTTKANKTLLCQIPNPVESQNFTSIVDFLATKIIKPLAEAVR